MARRSLVLGIDGGSTGSVGILADDSGAVLARHEGAAMSIPSLGFENVARAFYVLAARCCDDARCKPSELSAVVLGNGAADRQTDRSRLCESVNVLFAKGGAKPLPLVIEPSARTALEGAFDGGEGVVIVADSGSVVVGKTRAGEVVSVGGWGRVIGDEGSGYFIGREALLAVVHEYEHRGTAGRLREVLGRRYHFDTREGIIAAINQENFDIAALAPSVMETASTNDLVAQRILNHAASLLADQARIIVMQMGLLRKVRLCMMGSLVDGNTIYGNALHMKLLKVLPQVEVRRPLHEPAYGAMLLAAARLRKT